MKRNMQMFPQDRKEYEEELLKEEEKELPKQIKHELEYAFINSVKVFKQNYKFPKNNENNAISTFLVNLYNHYGEKFIVAIDNIATLFKFIIDSKTKKITCAFIKSADDHILKSMYFLKNDKLDGLVTHYHEKTPNIPHKVQTYIDGKLLEENYVK